MPKDCTISEVNPNIAAITAQMATIVATIDVQTRSLSLENQVGTAY
jgi:hypothetical protein